MVYVNYERSYDKFEGSENVYRPYLDYQEGDVFVPGDAQTYNQTGPTLKKEFPEVEEYVRLFQLNKVSFVQGTQILQETRGWMADASYFDIFKTPMISGVKNTALKEPHSLVLTESLARKLYGNISPLGKTLSVFWGSSEIVLTVKGVMKDVPENTHLKINFLISFSTIKSWDAFSGQQKPNWNQNNYFTYIKVDPNANINVLQQKIMESDFEDNEDERHNIERLEDIHLYADKPYEAEANGSVTRVKFLTAIAFIILILSWLNYINLSTTKSLERAKEIGIRKVAGARKEQLIAQSLLESMILNVISIIVAITLAMMLMPLYNSFKGKTLTFELLDLGRLLPIMGIILFGMVAAGFYPAILLSNYTPSKALKGKASSSAKGLNIRKGLIIVQFTATIILLIGTIVVSKQIQFLKEQPIGADLSQVIAVTGDVLTEKQDSLIKQDFTTLVTALDKFPFVAAVSTAQTYPGGGYESLSSFMGITYPNGVEDNNKIYYTYRVSPKYFEVMGIEFLAGQEFLPSGKEQNSQVVINEKLAHMMGYAKAEEAVDKTLKFNGEKRMITGVFKDYHHFGLKNTVAPMTIIPNKINDVLLLKIKRSATSSIGIANVISQVERKWKEVLPQSTFNYTFIDKKFEAQYDDDKTFGKAFGIFTALAIFIASLGLFGLTSYTCLQRKKEISIRKVNGASISKILMLLNVDFVKWIGIAFVLAVPIAWYAMNAWLQNFALKTNLSGWIFLLAGIAALGIIIITVSWQSWEAATDNPIEALRRE